MTIYIQNYSTCYAHSLPVSGPHWHNKSVDQFHCPLDRCPAEQSPDSDLADVNESPHAQSYSELCATPLATVSGMLVASVICIDTSYAGVSKLLTPPVVDGALVILATGPPA